MEVGRDTEVTEFRRAKAEQGDLDAILIVEPQLLGIYLPTLDGAETA